MKKLWRCVFVVAVLLSSCATQPAHDKSVQGEKNISVPENIPENVPKLKAYDRSFDEARKAVGVALRKQGFSDLRENRFGEIYTENLAVRNPNPSDVTEDVIRVLVKARVEIYPNGKSVVVSYNTDFSKITGSSYQPKLACAKTESALAWDFFKEVGDLLGGKSP